MKFIKLVFLALFTVITFSASAQVVVPKGDDGAALKKFLGDKVAFSYPHPRDTVSFGEVFFKFNFETSLSEMGNKKGSYTGNFFTLGNTFCIFSKEFLSTCFLIKEDGKLVFLHNQEINIPFTLK